MIRKERSSEISTQCVCAGSPLGRRGPDAARQMGLSARTVEKHLQAAYLKLGVANSSEAAATAWAAVGVRLPEA